MPVSQLSSYTGIWVARDNEKRRKPTSDAFALVHFFQVWLFGSHLSVAYSTVVNYKAVELTKGNISTDTTHCS